MKTIKARNNSGDDWKTPDDIKIELELIQLETVASNMIAYLQKRKELSICGNQCMTNTDALNTD